MMKVYKVPSDTVDQKITSNDYLWSSCQDTFIDGVFDFLGSIFFTNTLDNIGK